MKNKIIILFIILTITLIVILGILYTTNNKSDNNISENSNNDFSIVDENNNNEKNKQENEYEIKNNGKYFVGIDDKIYFWKLKGESRDQNYSEISDIKNDLICMNSLGEQNIILNDFGIGKIYVSNSKLFLSSHTNSEKGVTYSVDFNGQNKKVYDNIEEILDANNDYIVYKSNSKIYTMNTANDKQTEIFNMGEYEFLKLYNNTIYYYRTPKFGDTTITLKSMNTEGKQNKFIKEVSVEGIKISNDYSIVDIMKFDVDEKNFYLAYGYVDETKSVVQDAEICIFKRDNQQEQIILKTCNEFEFYEEDKNRYLVAVLEKNYEKIQTVDINTFENLSKDVPKNVFEKDIVLSENFKQNQTIISDELLVNSAYFEKIDGYAYYLLDIYTTLPENEVESKITYKQEKSYCIKQNLENNEYEILYEF